MTTKITEQNISQLANAGVNWQSVFTGDGSTGLTAVAGRGYFIDTTSGTVTVTLPASPSAGDVVVLKDYARTWGTNAVSIASTTFDGDSNNPSFSTNGQTVTLVYMDGTKGWSLINEDTTTGLGAQFITATGGTVTTSGDYKIHTFTGDGTFCVSCVGNPAGSDTVSYMVVAGGGGSGGNLYHIQGGGGGGAGGFREGKALSDCYTASPLVTSAGLPVTATGYPITVGAGGGGGKGAGPSLPGSPTAGPGSNSIFSTITSAGGGRGGQPNNSPAPTTFIEGDDGGSGGGTGGNNSGAGGVGNTPPVSPPQGSNGGAGSTSSQTLGGSGGGATGAGSTAPGCSPPPSTPSRGAGATTHISASPVVYSTGGAYSHYNPAAFNPIGSASANTGNGADAQNAAPSPIVPQVAPNYDGKNGGSGIVIIRYKFQ